MMSAIDDYARWRAKGHPDFPGFYGLDEFLQATFFWVFSTLDLIAL